MLLHRFLSAVLLVRLSVKKTPISLIVLILYGSGMLFACEDPIPQATLEGMRDGGLAMIVNTNQVDDRSLLTEINGDYDTQIIIVDSSTDDSFTSDFMLDGRVADDASLSPDIDAIDMLIDEVFGLNGLRRMSVGC